MKGAILYLIIVNVASWDAVRIDVYPSMEACQSAADQSLGRTSDYPEWHHGDKGAWLCVPAGDGQ